MSVVLLTASFRGIADQWGSIEQTEFFSPTRKHVLRIQPHSDWSSKPGHCRATLLRLSPLEQEVWSRYLINNYAPVRVFVSDSGTYVLTMDEWGEVGKLPVVMYGRHGRLIQVHSTDSLGLKEDTLHIDQTESSYWWNADSVSFFDPEENMFFIRLHWGRWIALELASGKILRREQTFLRNDLGREHEKKWEQIENYRKKTLAEHAIRMLGSNNGRDRKTGALICGQEKLTAAIPSLRNLLADEQYVVTNKPKEWTRAFFVRKAAKEALEAMGQKVEKVTMEEPDNR